MIQAGDRVAYDLIGVWSPTNHLQVLGLVVYVDETSGSAYVEWDFIDAESQGFLGKPPFLAWVPLANLTVVF